jgi:ABC-type multidrug transport system ATPase subunit
MVKNLNTKSQHDILWPELSAYQHLRFFGIFQGMPNLEENVQTMLKAVRLNKEGSHPSSSFSGGMKRRLSVAIASLGDKKVVILDEPTTGMVSNILYFIYLMVN